MLDIIEAEVQKQASLRNGEILMYLLTSQHNVLPFGRTKGDGGKGKVCAYGSFVAGRKKAERLLEKQEKRHVDLTRFLEGSRSHYFQSRGYWSRLEGGWLGPVEAKRIADEVWNKILLLKEWLEYVRLAIAKEEPCEACPMCRSYKFRPLTERQTVTGGRWVIDPITFQPKPYSSAYDSLEEMYKFDFVAEGSESEGPTIM